MAEWLECTLDLQFRGHACKSLVMLVNSRLVCLRLVGILNPVMFDLNYLFHAIARPVTSISAINTTEGK